MADGVDLSEYNGGSLVITCGILLVLSWIAVGLRTYTRAVLMKSFQADDWLMFIAQVWICGELRIDRKYLTIGFGLDYLHRVLRIYSGRCPPRSGSPQCSRQERGRRGCGAHGM